MNLQVIDWGGTGETVVLLTGLGGNAHVYGQSSFQWNDHFHVIGITRRGYLPSSQPADGYDVPTRVADDIAVLDSLKIDRVVLVGHSIAGSDSSALAVSHPERVDKVVYWDALDLSQRNEVPGPPAFFGFFTEADTKSLWTYAAANARYQGVRKPEPAICPCVQFDNAEHPVGSNAGCSSGRAISAGVAAVPLVNWSRHCGTETGRSSRCQCWKSGRHGLRISTRLIRRYSMNSIQDMSTGTGRRCASSPGVIRFPPLSSKMRRLRIHQ